MTAATATALFPDDLSGIPNQRLNEALPVASWREKYPDAVQDRTGEEDAAVGEFEELRAIYTSPWFWELAAELPANTIIKGGFGRPRDYPDWLLFLLDCAAGISGKGSRRGAVTMLRDKRVWADFARHVDAYVPEGWTRLTEVTHKPSKHARRDRARATARTAKTEKVKALTPVRDLPTVTAVPVRAVAPSDHHLDYFAMRWRGFKRVNGTWTRVTEADPWFGVRQRVFATFRKVAVEQAQAMGLLDPTQPFGFTRADRNQSVGFDGVVMDMPRRKDNPNATSCAEHETCGGKSKAYGSKYTIASTRINGQYGSRVILDLAHTGHDEHSRYATEPEAILDIAPILRDLSGGGLRIVLSDSILRGRAVVELQRQWLTVANYTHAESNPDRDTKGRLADTRVEKSHLRRVCRHTDANGLPCEHALYWVGGELVERIIDVNGDATVRPATITEYQQRGVRTTDKDGRVTALGTRREYFIVTITCPIAGDFTERIPLFHTDATSTDPDYNWGEVARVFAPTSAEGQFLYGARNDTESRHTNLKARAKYLPIDVPGQELRLLGAAVTMNAVAWQLHLQAHGENNVLDDTA